MGNCMFKGYSDNSASTAAVLDHKTVVAEQMMIKVVTANGGVMELYAPITAEQITSEFPGHGLFRGPDPARHSDNPLLHKDHLHPGQLYYLLPLSLSAKDDVIKAVISTPYRMSFDAHKTTISSKRSDPDVTPRYNGTGVWKVRLVINPEQLSDILSQDAKTEELIESVRTVAKCGTSSTTGGTTSSAASASSSSSSDQGSVSSCNFHWKGSF